MHFFKNFLIKYKELISYLVFGVLTTIVNFIIYFYLCSIGLNYKISNIIAIFCSILFAYITNKIFVFKILHIKNILQEFIKFVSFRLVSSIFDMAFLIFLVDYIKTPNFIAKVLTSVIVVVLNYIFSKLFIFRKEK